MSLRATVLMLLEEAARWHAEAARAPERAEQLLAEYRERYRIDEKFRREIDDGARQAHEEAERRKWRALQQLGETLH